MKIHHQVLTVAAAIVFGYASFANEAPASEQDAEIILKIDDHATLEDRISGFIMAGEVNNKLINEKLVSLLDSQAPGGKRGCMILASSWHEALVILVKRFPECGISKSPITYDKCDVDIFRKWWLDRSETQDLGIEEIG